MASDKFVLTRPIEVGDNEKNFTIDPGGGGVESKVMTTGVYGSIATLLKEFETQCNSGAASVDVTVNTDFKVEIDTNDATGLTEIVFTDANLHDILGFADQTQTGAEVYTADYTPLYCWLPNHVRADQNTWKPNHKQNFKGQRAQSGIVSGLSTGKVLYSAQMKLQYEHGYSLQWSRATTAPRKVRCLDQLVDGSRSDYPSSGNVSVGGFYFWPDYTNCQPLASMDAGDASTFNLASGADTYAFCEFDPGFDVSVDASVDVGHEYYNVTLPIATSTYPSTGWSAP